MSIEVDFVHEFMAEVAEVAPTELRGARSSLDEAIAEEARVAMEPASDRPGGRAGRRPKRRLRWGVGVAVAAAAAIAAALVVVVPPGRTPTSPAPAAAAEINRLAEASVPLPPLSPGEWYTYQLKGALSANVSTGSGTSELQATAHTPVAIGDWSNANGAVCTSEQFGTATFSSAAGAQAWKTMGLVATPANQPATGCSAGALGRGTSPWQPLDVSNLTHDPTTLVTELESGTTGISAIDNPLPGEPSNIAAFRRLTELLVGPVTGQWSGFGQEMLKTMALVPGVTSLGAMTGHSGTQGVAFTMPAQVTPNSNNRAQPYVSTSPTVILDPQNGTLLEVRNLSYPVLQSAAQDFVGSPSALVFSQGVSYGVTAEWLDPVAGLQVVEQSSVPSWIGSIHIIEAVTAPSTTDIQLSQLLNPILGSGNSDSAVTNVPVQGENTHDITVTGSLATAQSVANTLAQSGLFVSVSMKL